MPPPRRKIRKEKKKGQKTNVVAKVGYTNPTYMVAELKAGRLDPIVLTIEQRRACVAVMANGTMKAHELAQIFNCDRRTITNDLKAIRREVGAEVSSWTKDEIIGHLVKTAEDISIEAMRRENFALAWTIERDMFKMLEGIGLFQTKEKNSLTVTIEAVGEGYKRATQIIAQGLDPRMSGEIIDVDPIQTTTKPKTNALAFPTVLPDPPAL